MKDARWQRAKEIFYEARGLAPDLRASFIDTACAGDVELKADVEILLISYKSDFMEDTAIGAADLLIEPDLVPGQMIGRYRIGDLIGTGGMGQVFRAEDTELDRPVAFKVLPGDIAENDERVRRFIQEAKAASALNHPNILTIHEIGSFEGARFIVSEFVDGETLRERMRSGLTSAESLEIMCQVATALQAAHAAGIVHRDIKPENIMLRHDGLVKVLDFGLAKLTEADDPKEVRNADCGLRIEKADSPERLLSDNPHSAIHNPHLTAPGLIMGTVAYMSPEQARGQVVDSRTDLWSLGVVFHEMLTGESPFKGESVTDLVTSIIKHDPGSLDLKSISQELKPICTKALAKDKTARYQTAQDLLQDLQGEKKRMEYATHPTPYITVSSTDEMKTQLIRRRPTLSAEYIVTSVKQHKYATLVVALFVLTTGIGFSVYKYNAATPAPENSFSATVINDATTEKDLKFTKLAGQGRIFDIAISPDGKFIAYTTGEVAHSEAIHVRELSTQRDTEIVPAPAEEGVPTFLNRMTFAPDNSRILYRRQAPGNLQFFSVPLAGGPSVKIADHTVAASVSPDGRSIVFNKQNMDEKGDLQGNDLVITDIDGHNERILAHYVDDDGLSTEVPAWSPDGKAIAAWFDFVEDKRSHRKLFAISISDGSKQPLSDQKWDYISSAVWMPDGSLVITAKGYQIGDNEPMQLWRVTRTEAKSITTDAIGYTQLSGTRDGNVLVAVQSVTRRDLWVVTGNDMRTARPVTFSGEIARYSGFGQLADGSVVVGSRLSNNIDLWKISLDGKTRTQLTKNAGTNTEDRTTPDGRFIVFTSNRDGANRVYRMDADGGNVKQLTDKPRTRCISISKDGRSVYYLATDDVSRQIYKMPIDGGPSTLVANVSIEGRFYDVSNDGRIAEYVYDGRKGELRLYSAEGRIMKNISLPPTFSGSMPIHWTPDGKSIASNDLRDGASQLWMVPVNGNGQAKPFTTFGPGITADFNWSKDRKQMFVTRNTTISDGLMITNVRQ